MAQKGQISRSSKEVKNTCEICDNEFITVRKSACCSERCRQILRSNKKLENEDHITCPLCSQKVKQITAQHARSHGFNTTKEMQEQLNMQTITCESVKDKVRGENNPGFNHGGKFSKFSENFVHGYDKEWHEEWAKTHSEFRNENKELFKTNIEYWQAQTDDAEEADKLYKEFQIRDLSYFVNKYGEEEGNIRHKQKISRWITSMPRINYSVVSQELFDNIMKEYTHNGNIYYATYCRADMQQYENKEYRLSVDGSYVMPDFVDLSTKKIIEFDGDYWHSEAVANPQRESLREDRIKNEGYIVYHVKEHDYKKDKEKVIQECINFLTQ